MKREFLSTNEVAQILGISPFTVRRYIQARKLKAVKLEGSYRVRQTHLEHFIEMREIETEEELAALEADPGNGSVRRIVEPMQKRGPAAPPPARARKPVRKPRVPLRRRVK